MSKSKSNGSDLDLTGTGAAYVRVSDDKQELQRHARFGCPLREETQGQNRRPPSL